jgi:hypothetical protein
MIGVQKEDEMSIKEVIDSGLGAISISQAAGLMGCDPRTVSRGIAQGDIESFPVGRRVLVPVIPLLKKLGVEIGGAAGGR